MNTPKGSIPYRLIYELGNAFASRLDADELIELVIRRCREVLEVEGVAVILLDAERGEFYFPYFSDCDPIVSERLSRVRFSSSKGIAGDVLRTARPAKVNDVSADPRFHPEVDECTGLRTRCILAAPLVANDSRLGVIEAVNPIGRDAFSDDELVLLEALAQSVALALHNASRVDRLRASEQKLRAEVGALRRDLARHDVADEIVGASPEMGEVFRLMSSAATSSISVLLEGETGTGKELIARALHRMSARADKPFLAINCAALSEHLLASELFGHRRGAFTGATQDQPGLFRAASGGVIFLDEIGEMPLSMQPALLRVLQDGEIIAVGDTRPERVDVRIFSATNCDLRAAVSAGTFRADLYYRLAAFPIHLPALRLRQRDIPLLAIRFLSIASARHRKDIREIDPEALQLLERYEWPGNIRELQNEIERAVVLTAAGDTVCPEQLSAQVRAPAGARERSQIAAEAAPSSGGPATDAGSLRDARATFEARYIAEVLARNRGNVSRSADSLGISRISLQRKIKEYGLRSSQPPRV